MTNQFIKTQQALAWKQHVRDMEKHAFKDPKKYKAAFDTLITQIIQNTGEELMRSMPEEGIKWMQEGFDKKRKGYTEGFNKARDTLKKHIASLTGVE